MQRELFRLEFGYDEALDHFPHVFVRAAGSPADAPWNCMLGLREMTYERSHFLPSTEPPAPPPRPPSMDDAIPVIAPPPQPQCPLPLRFANLLDIDEGMDVIEEVSAPACCASSWFAPLLNLIEC